jgi:hypothetical protein
MDVARLHDQLTQRAFLHDDPEAYLAGVDDALEVLATALVTTPQSEDARDRRGA